MKPFVLIFIFASAFIIACNETKQQEVSQQQETSIPKGNDADVSTLIDSIVEVQRIKDSIKEIHSYIAWKDSMDAIAEEEPEIIPTGKITTIADGMDVGQVNLWSSTSSSRRKVGSLGKGAKVIILEDSDPYYLIETKDGKKKGYCMKGFVIRD